MKTLRAGLVLTAVAALALTGCATTDADVPESPRPSASASPQPSATTQSPEPTVESTPGTLEERIAAGEVLMDIPESWGNPQVAGQVEEGYILQDFTWTLSDEGTVAAAVGLTAGQGHGLSGGETFEAHVAGMVDVLTVQGQPAPTLTRSVVDGVDAVRIWAPLADRDMLIVLYLYDLGGVYYEFGYYQASGEPNGGVLLAGFDEVAGTFSTAPR